MHTTNVGILAVVLLASAAATAAEGPAADVRSEVDEILLGRRISFGVGTSGDATLFRGGIAGDVFFTQQLEARWLFGGFTLEGAVLHALPMGGSALFSVTGQLRVGWTWRRTTVTAGALAQVAPGTPATQWAPTLTAAHTFDRFGLSAGIFDVHGIALARASFEQELFGVGYVAPIGLEAHTRFRLGSAVFLRVQALAFRVFNAQVAFVSLSGVFEPDRIAREEFRP
jgi:hypothetical protein